jgi:hypothetical protein
MQLYKNYTKKCIKQSNDKIFLQFWHSAQVYDDNFNIWQNSKELAQPKTQTDVKKWYFMKDSKSQKQISRFSFELKNECFWFFCISALVVKMSQLKKRMLFIMIISDYLSSNIIICNCFLDLIHFRELGQIYKNIFVCFWLK